MQRSARPVISGPNMYSMLIHEFERIRPPECKRCRVPLPFWGPAAGNSNGYWYMRTPADCPYNCRQLIAELWARVSTEYVINPPARPTVSGAKYLERPNWVPDT